jgi:hypothetical protein
MRSLLIEGREFRCRGRFISTCELTAPWYESIDDPETVIRALLKTTPRPDLFTFFQRVPRVEPEFPYHHERYGVAVMEITGYADWSQNRINKKTRYLIRKAGQNGVVVRTVDLDDDLVRGVSGIYNESPIRQGKPFPHFNDSMERVRAENATYPDRSVHIGAYCDAELIGYARLIFEQEFTDVVQFVSKNAFQAKGTANALMAKIVEVCASRGVRFLAYGDWTLDGLTDFKRHNGFTRMVLPRYYVPLTLRGRLVLLAGLHRRIADRLPSGVAHFYRRVRKNWNEHRLRTTRVPR